MSAAFSTVCSASSLLTCAQNSSKSRNKSRQVCGCAGYRDHHDRVKHADDDAGRASRMGPLFDLDFPETAAHPDFKNQPERARCCLTFAKRASTHAASARRACEQCVGGCVARPQGPAEASV